MAPRNVSLVGLVLLACACAHTDAERHDVWVPYTHRGVLYRVRADGSDRAKLRKRVPRGEKLYDLWSDPAPQPGTETIAVIRGRNLSFNVFPADPAEFDQSWELVLIDGDEERVLHTSREELSRPRWSSDGKRLLAQVGRHGVLVWGGRVRTRRESHEILLACFGPGDTIDLVTARPYTIGWHRFDGHRVPDAIRNTDTVKRLFGRAGDASVLRPPLHVTSDGRFTFYYRKKEGFLPRGWIEGIDAQTGATFKVTTLWRGIYVE